MRKLWIGLALVGLTACSTEAPAADPATTGPATAAAVAERLGVEVLESHPHDPAAFTQGLELRDGVLYEGTGLNGQSDIRIVELETGEVSQRVPVPDNMFGEGITVVDDQIWQLTWQEGVAFRRDRATLEELDRVSYQGEGWGICYDGDRLVMSNGSDRLAFRDPDSFDETGSVAVTLDGQPLTMLNELECVAGKVWANVWQTDQIVRIDPATGVVEAVVDASGLLTEAERASTDVLNGIAAIPDTDTFLVTGKLWPKTFEVRFVPAG